MRSILVSVFAFALLTQASPATGDANYVEQNMAYILELAGYAAMPDEIIEVDWNGALVAMPAEEAVRRAAEIHARTDLRSLGEAALGGTIALGDIVFAGLGCERVVESRVSQPIYQGPSMQFFIHPGRVDNVVQCDGLYTIEWTTKLVQRFDSIQPALVVGSGHVTIFWGLSFGAVNGAVTKVPEA